MTSSEPVAAARGAKLPEITYWHGAVFFQAFMAFFTAMLGVWYSVVGASPGSISEYLPREAPADLTTIAPFFIFALIWLVPLYWTLKGKRMGLLGAAVFGLFNLVATMLGFVSRLLPAPDFSDFLFFPMLVFGIIVSVMAWRSPKI